MLASSESDARYEEIQWAGTQAKQQWHWGSNWSFTLGVTVISNPTSSILKEKKYSKFNILLLFFKCFCLTSGHSVKIWLNSALRGWDIDTTAPPPALEVWQRHWLQMMSSRWQHLCPEFSGRTNFNKSSYLICRGVGWFSQTVYLTK